MHIKQGIRYFNDLDSPELVLVYDFGLFLDDCLSGDHPTEEILVHGKVVKFGQRQLLKHPLMNVFLVSI
jgi:hypothetical protein